MRIPCALLLILGACPGLSVRAETPPGSPHIVGIEEDWVLTLSEPDPLKASPQIMTWMSPTDSLDGFHFELDLNHVQRPGFISGGLQTKALNGENVEDNRYSENETNFRFNGETIRWTQRMLLNNGDLTFEVANGTSESWGAFGGGSTKVRLLGTGLVHLNHYSPNKSAEWSGIGFAANRVTTLQLTTVRVYLSDGTSQSVEVNLDVR